MKKYALVTGGSRGLGRAICQMFAQRNIPVLINYQTNQQAAEEVRDSIIACGGEADLLQFNGMHPKIKITYRPTDAAKIIFDYEIRDTLDGSLLASGRSTQVFMDKQYQLVLYNPPFYEEWKQKWLSK